MSYSLKCEVCGIIKKIQKYDNNWYAIVQGNGYKQRYKLHMSSEDYDYFLENYPIETYIKVIGCGYLDYFIIGEKKIFVELHIIPTEIEKLDMPEWLKAPKVQYK